MTLPSSGPLSMSAINTEFGRGNNLNSYRGTVWYTDAGASGTFPSGAISFSDFYGKRATSPTFSFTISTAQTNANLRTLAVNAGWNQSSAVVATINSGVTISSNSTGTPALTINGSFPGGLSLVNNGTIVGMGGGGGNGGSGSAQTNGTAGAGGGLALSVATSVTITNNGTIAGGGGGGGGGGAAGLLQDKSGWRATSSGGGGGGGRSSNAANSAAGSRGGTGTALGSNGAVGTVSAAGGGGAGGYTTTSYAGRTLSATGGTGGTGGGWGSSGASGANGAVDSQGYSYSVKTGGGGGAGGGAVVGNAYISWAVLGTRLGGIS